MKIPLFRLTLILIIGTSLLGQSQKTNTDSLEAIEESIREKLEKKKNTTETVTPYWVKNRKIRMRSTHYFGIGKSKTSQSKADDKARVDFSKNVHVHVKSMMDHKIEESNFKIKEDFKAMNSVTSDLSLKGLSIYERWKDPKTHAYYSLMKYTKDEYDKIIKEEIEREIKRLKNENILEEEKQTEELRHKISLMKLDSTRAMSDISKERSEESIKNEKMKRKQERKKFILRNYKDFIKMKPYHRVIDLVNAEIPEKRHEISMKPTLNPKGFSEAYYAIHFKIFELSNKFQFLENSMEKQDVSLKLQLLQGQGEIYRSSIALGIIAFTPSLPEWDGFSEIGDNLKKIKYGNSFLVSANINIPQYYLATSIYIEKRKIAFGANWYPFFNNFKDKLSFALELDFIMDKDFRNRFGDAVMLQPGIHFIVLPNKFYTLLAYEDNEYITLSLDIHL